MKGQHDTSADIFYQYWIEYYILSFNIQYQFGMENIQTVLFFWETNITESPIPGKHGHP